MLYNLGVLVKGQLANEDFAVEVGKMSLGTMFDLLRIVVDEKIQDVEKKCIVEIPNSAEHRPEKVYRSAGMRFEIKYLTCEQTCRRRKSNRSCENLGPQSASCRERKPGC